MEKQQLVELSTQEILINFTLNTKCRTNIVIKSLHPTTPVAFKLQTSSPQHFHVNPPNGLIPPLSSTTFQIVLKPLHDLPNTFPRSHHRFLLKTSLSPPHLSPEHVNNWFNSDQDIPTFDVKLKVYFVGQFLLTQAVGNGNLEGVKGILKKQRLMVSEMETTEAEALYDVSSSFPNIMSLLLEAGLRRRSENDEERIRIDKGWSELHVVAYYDRVEEIERLLLKGGGG